MFIAINHFYSIYSLIIQDNEGGDVDMEEVEEGGDDQEEEGAEEGETDDIAEEQEDQPDETNEVDIRSFSHQNQLLL